MVQANTCKGLWVRYFCSCNWINTLYSDHWVVSSSVKSDQIWLQGNFLEKLQFYMKHTGKIWSVWILLSTICTCSIKQSFLEHWRFVFLNNLKWNCGNIWVRNVLKILIYVDREGVGGASWWWLYGSWICNYLCNQCLSPLKLCSRSPFNVRYTRFQYYMIKFISDLRQVCGFLWVVRFPPPIKLTATIYLIYCWKYC